MTTTAQLIELQEAYDGLLKKALLLKNELKQRRKATRMKSVSSARKKIKTLRRELNILIDRREVIENKIKKKLREIEK